MSAQHSFTLQLKHVHVEAGDYDPDDYPPLNVEVKTVSRPNTDDYLSLTISGPNQEQVDIAILENYKGHAILYVYTGQHEQARLRINLTSNEVVDSKTQ